MSTLHTTMTAGRAATIGTAVGRKFLRNTRELVAAGFTPAPPTAENLRELIAVILRRKATLPDADRWTRNLAEGVRILNPEQTARIVAIAQRTVRRG